jgi:predicted HicB family RNase H-like nuclease
MMLYKGYAGSFKVDPEAGIIFGRVTGLRDVITFQGETVAQATQAFRDSVDDYLEFCAGHGEPPEKPFTGRFLLRMTPALHRHLAYLAEDMGESINSLVERALMAHYGSGMAIEGPWPARGAPPASEPDVEGTPDHMSDASALADRLEHEFLGRLEEQKSTN